MIKRILEIKAKDEKYRIFVTGQVYGKQSKKNRLDQPIRSAFMGFALRVQEVPARSKLDDHIKTLIEVRKIPVFWSEHGTAMSSTEGVDFSEEVNVCPAAIKAFFKPGIKNARTAVKICNFLNQEGVDIIDAHCVISQSDDDYDYYNGFDDVFRLEPAKSKPLHKVGNVLITSRILQDPTIFIRPARKSDFLHVDERQMILI